MKLSLSVVIAYHQEGQQFMEEAVQQIKDTIDVESYEIIVVDDCSREPLQDIPGVKVLRQEENLGVGQALRRGIWEAQSENIWFQGSDIRFIPNGWASKMLKEIEEHPSSLSCATCIGINKDDMDVAARRNRSRRNGARILFFHDKKSHKKMPSNFRNILEAQWLPVNKDKKESFEVPCILGAAYGAKKEWLQYIDIWWGHRSWGTLEPMCSLQSWLMGGTCRTVPAVEVGHIFKASGSHGTKLHHLIYNKIMVATLLFEEYDAKRLIGFLDHKNPQVIRGMEMFKEYEEEIMAKREEFEGKITYDIRDYVKRWGVDFREDS